jgi:hypothetical protein
MNGFSHKFSMVCAICRRTIVFVGNSTDDIIRAVVASRWEILEAKGFPWICPGCAEKH